jgi:pyruvate dehydrogenase E1 component
MTLSVPSAHQDSERDEVFRAIEDRVLWLATAIIDHANRARPNHGGRD